ncbi:MAG: UDP-N-acetylglucosamine 2-epimerase (non-hydrolyzing) [Ignavibacteria bacterium]|nr:UDP-N-acetylglucosamine 2-epimerase (non-hydrolyzing) [Ignavibacteria bacterium]
MKKILLVVGARPNFMKVAPVYKEFKKHPEKIDVRLCHTGQHYDVKMSDVFFRQLGIPEPDFYLGVGSGSHAVQTANIMIEFEKVCLEMEPDVVLVAGDVNSTIACGLVAVKLGIKLGHIEAGLRSFDRTMPEEVNRLLTDAISDYLFVTEKSGMENLRYEGVPEEKIFFTGNCMIDTLVSFLPSLPPSPSRRGAGGEVAGQEADNMEYLLLTFHRPANVDTKEFFISLKEFVDRYGTDNKIVFPIHPRTRTNMEKFGVTIDNPNLILTEPLGYLEFLHMMRHAKAVITDSGGVQEETTYLGVPCITVRDNTERPITVEVGTNILAGTDFKNVFSALDDLLSGKIKQGRIPDLWDGKAASRVVEVFL